MRNGGSWKTSRNNKLTQTNTNFIFNLNKEESISHVAIVMKSYPTIELDKIINCNI
jgi:hypothetical protein